MKIINFLLNDLKWKYYSLYGYAIITAIFDLIGIGLIFPLMSVALKLDYDYGDFPVIFAKLINFTETHLNLYLICLLLVIVFTGKNVARFLVSYNSSKTMNNVRGQWMERLFIKYIQSNYNLFINTKLGILNTNLYTLTEETASCLKSLVEIFMLSISALVAIILLFLISWKITIFSSIIIVIGYYFISRPLTKKAHELSKNRIASYQQVNSIPNEAFRGIREIKSFSYEPEVLKFYSLAVNFMVNLRNKINYYQFLPLNIPETLLIIVLSINLIILNKIPTIHISAIFPLVITYTYASFRLYGSGSSLLGVLMKYISVKPGLMILYNELYEQDNYEIEINKNEITDTITSLQFQEVRFSYIKGKEILKGIDFKFKRGTFNVIMGESGVGKSTIADLIIRLYSPDSGYVLFNDMKINDYSLQSCRQKVGFVSQDTFLINSSIRDNIVFGLNGNVSEESIVEAAAKADCHNFIIENENGYDSIVGEAGGKLSGGQKQRIAIARALLKKPEILILDEPTSALDKQSSNKVIDTINKIKDQLIVLLITHDLELAKDADNIMVLLDGKIKKIDGFDKLSN